MIEYLFIAILANFITWWYAPLDPVRDWISDRIAKDGVWYKELFCPKCQAFTISVVWAIVTGDVLAIMIAPFLATIVMWILSHAESHE